MINLLVEEISRVFFPQFNFKVEREKIVKLSRFVFEFMLWFMERYFNATTGMEHMELKCSTFHVIFHA